MAQLAPAVQLQVTVCARHSVLLIEARSSSPLITDPDGMHVVNPWHMHRPHCKLRSYLFQFFHD